MQKLPDYLYGFIVDQHYDDYTAQDHAVWRYAMRQNLKHLSRVAHHSYLDGIKNTGISIDEIPKLSEMNKILSKIGWAAVTVDGFIPPAAFMEFQAYQVLPIAAGIRPIENIEYTPAPDILHEVAGHAPIIANEEYAKFLQHFGVLGSKAFSSKEDHRIYEAIRHLSILKTNPKTNPDEINIASLLIEKLDQQNTSLSEMSQIRNLHWWTVEYGLIGSFNNPKIYGAGLLSSISESLSCLKPEVKKIPLTLEARNVRFDITTCQPQLFVTPDFKHLNDVLNDFSKEMACSRGGLESVEKAISSGAIATATYSSNLQVSGIFSNVYQKNGQVVYIQTKSPTQLCYKDIQLESHGKDYHGDGFGSPVGSIKNTTKPLEFFTDKDLLKEGIQVNDSCLIQFESGVKVKGKLIKILRKNGKNLIFTFSNCLVTYRNEVLFEPEWGLYDMAVGERIVSANEGPADAKAFDYSISAPVEKTIKLKYNNRQIKLHNLYQIARNFRLNTCPDEFLIDLFEEVKSNFSNEWLLSIELLEIAVNKNITQLIPLIREHINQIKTTNPEFSGLIDNGLEV